MVKQAMGRHGFGCIQERNYAGRRLKLTEYAAQSASKRVKVLLVSNSVKKATLLHANFSIPALIVAWSAHIIFQRQIVCSKCQLPTNEESSKREGKYPKLVNKSIHTTKAEIEIMIKVWLLKHIETIIQQPIPFQNLRAMTTYNVIEDESTMGTIPIQYYKNENTPTPPLLNSPPRVKYRKRRLRVN
ncbi:transmembrane protein, putative [Medicago truncatula]|uniref:Transmembrane protein, putative n=1 Tax=Medicago truncatula TaxID=3880 RepID=A0A072TJR9_MEDTR|nr:transmembrane protein, putative [Medicago truncatula]